MKRFVLDAVCERVCPKHCIGLIFRSKRMITPLDSSHRTVVMAIERGMLQNLIFDNQVLFSHRALSAVIGVILNLSPVKKVLAGKQLQSLYLDRLINHF
jgi:hypothetical protein